MNDSGRMGMDKRKYFLLKTLIFLFMFVAALIALFPFYWMFVTAVKPVDEIFAFPPKLWPGELSGVILQLHCPEHPLEYISEIALL